MRDILEQLHPWWEAGERFALAVVTDTRRSAPRGPGASMAVTADGRVAGSVSGGCVEGAVFQLAQRVLDSGRAETVSYGISDEEAFSVGLTCGGELDVLVAPVDVAGAPWFGAVATSIRALEPVALATVLDGPHTGRRMAVWPDDIAGVLPAEGLQVAVRDDARGMLEQGVTGIRHYGTDGERRRDDVAVFVASFAPPPPMLVFGAIDFAAAVARIGAFLGFHVTVCDAREVFATPQRFPAADEVVVEWPHRYLEQTDIGPRTVICVLTHDPKFDVPVLEVALRTEAGYIGAMGSRRTHEDRLERLREAGLTDDELARLKSPIGLDIGARTPEEVAVAVAAEVIAGRWGGSGLPLGATAGRIHDHQRERDPGDEPVDAP